MKLILIALIIPALCTMAGASVLIPTIADPGFEKEPLGWSWQTMNAARASYVIDTTDPHSGKRCVVFSNESGQAPHVYGRFNATANVVPNARYELSCWVRGEEVSTQPGGFHMTDWNSYTLNFPTGTFDWQKVSIEFTTKHGQYSINLGINIANKCQALAVDDVSLRPLGGRLQADGIDGMILTEPKVIGQGVSVPVCVFLTTSSKKAATVESTVMYGERKIAEKRSPVRPGENQIDWEWKVGNLPFGDYTLRVRVLDTGGVVLAQGSVTTEVIDSPVLKEIDGVEARKKEFDALYAQCKAKGINLDYPSAAKVMLEQFIPYARDDVRHGLEYRAKWAIGDFNRSLDDGIALMKAYLQDPTLEPVTKRFRTGNVSIEGLSFIGDRVDSKGRKDVGPVFFCGLGHFGQVREDIPRFPSYGVNIIQIEVGPSITFPTEDKVDLTALKNVAKVLDNAAKHNIMVNVLLSPHYFPAWAMNKWPHLGKGGGGWLGFCVDDPAAKQVIEQFLRVAVPLLKDKPALHSFCLTNEPLLIDTVNCDNTKGLWVDYLKRVHGHIGTLNFRYGTPYASFDDVPYSGDAQACDWTFFNQQRFAGWHKWMADIIHQLAPNVPTHAKVMSNAMNAGQVGFNTDQELFGNLLEINGNDCYSFPTGNPDWPMDPWMLNTSYDLQRSFARKPVFNSENHISPDGSQYYIPAEHFRTALWQGAIHGQGATTIWVWERDYDNKWGFLGNILDRPACAQAVGTTCLDLNRFAEEVTALETARARVAILYSMSSVIRHGQHTDAAMRAYQALNSCGVKIDFISEKQLAAGKGADYRMIIVPEAETITDAAFQAIRSLLSTRLLFMNECFTRNEYGKKRDPQAIEDLLSPHSALATPDSAFRNPHSALRIPDGDPEKVIWPALRKELDLAAISSAYSLVDAKTGEPIWGVEWLPVKVGGRTVINIVNLRGKPYDVKLLRAGIEIEAHDLLSLGGREKVTTLLPLTPVLAEVN